MWLLGFGGCWGRVGWTDLKNLTPTPEELLGYLEDGRPLGVFGEVYLEVVHIDGPFDRGDGGVNDESDLGATFLRHPTRFVKLLLVVGRFDPCDLLLGKTPIAVNRIPHALKDLSIFGRQGAYF